MKPIHTMKLFAITSLAAITIAVLLSGCGATRSSAHRPAALRTASKIDSRVEKARRMLSKQPNDLAALLEFGSVAMQKGRETGDLQWYVDGRKAFEKAVALHPEEPVAQHRLAYALTIFHQFGSAIRHARRAVAASPYDDEAWGVLSDAYTELGQYEKALDATQKMLDAKPSLAAYSRAAHLRWVYGDPVGAMEMMARAIQAGAGFEEHVAWCRVQLADMALKTGNLKLAREQYELALEATPMSKPAHAGVARLLRSEGSLAKAIDHLEIATDGMTQIPYLAELGDLYREIGDEAKATATHARIPTLIASHRSFGVYGDELNLASFWLDHDLHIDQALALVESEVSDHTSVQAYSTLAWAYFKAGRFEEADRAMKRALRHGTRDAVLMSRAAQIRHALGDRKAARSLAAEALAMNPYLHDARAREIAQG
ncbi:MAG TPA: tetratricopeptide repeat protein [Fimbriimonadaceae bacterium]|nr:tetratricopeptide repeat protein [Fimbriimonadaceae bacterium]